MVTRLDIIHCINSLLHLEFLVKHVRSSLATSFLIDPKKKLLSWLFENRARNLKIHQKPTTTVHNAEQIWKDKLLSLKLNRDLDYVLKLESTILNERKQRCRLCNLLLANADFLAHFKACMQSMKKKIRVSDTTSSIIQAIKAFEIERRKVRIKMDMPIRCVKRQKSQKNCRRSSMSFSDEIDLEPFKLTDAFDMFEKYKSAAESLSSLSMTFHSYVKDLRMDSFRAIHDNLVRQQIKTSLKSMPDEQLHPVKKKISTVLDLIETRLILVNSIITKEKIIQLERSNSTASTAQNKTSTHELLKKQRPSKSSFLNKLILQAEAVYPAGLPDLTSADTCSNHQHSGNSGSDDSSVSAKVRDSLSVHANQQPKIKSVNYHSKEPCNLSDRGLEQTATPIEPYRLERADCRFGKDLIAEIENHQKPDVHSPKLSQFSKYATDFSLIEMRSESQTPKRGFSILEPAKSMEIFMCDQAERLTESDKGEYFKNDVTLVGKIHRVSLSDFYYLKTLGKGSFGDVFLVQSKSSPEDVFALKVISRASNMTVAELNSLLNEGNVFGMVEGDFVTRAVSTFIHKNLICFLMEFMPGGDLGSLLAKEGALDEDDIRVYLAEIVLGLESLHQKGISHRDLKPENLLISQAGHIKLADYGLSEIKKEIVMSDSCEMISDLYFNSNFCLSGGAERVSGQRSALHHQLLPKDMHGGLIRIVGTPDYIAPEILKYGVYSTAVDFWAAGVIAYELLTNCPPFNDSTVEATFDNIKGFKIHWIPVRTKEDEDGISPELDSLIKGLLQPDPKKRLGSRSIDDIKTHPFFKGVQWDHLLEMAPPYRPPRFSLKKFEGGPKVDMGEFVTQHFSTVLKEMTFAGKHKLFKLGERNFEFMRYDLLHALNKRSAGAILQSLEKLKNLRAKICTQLSSIHDLCLTL